VALHLVERFALQDPAAKTMSRYGVSTPWQAYVQLRLEIYERLLADERVLLDHRWPHAMDLLAHARRDFRRVGLATMSYCHQVRRIFQILELEGIFDFVATRDDVEHGKPDPEIYRLVARELGESPEHCLVVEDSPTGVRAALAAGMACIAIPNPFTRESLHAAGLLDSRWIVDDPTRLLEVVHDRIHEASEN
jgi:HAD superfamily hydrolase (TIGR01509 family)